jgi:N-acetylmuramoyl-L-alanine amidase
MKRSVRQLLILCLCEFCITISIYAQHGTHQNSSLNEKGNNYFLARTRGSLSYIEYGPGDDRLGGAKMTYLDSGILLKVIDSLGTDYIVSLSSTLHAFIQKSSVQKDTQSVYPDHYLSGNWKTYKDNRFDHITINMPERLPYRGSMQVNPNRLIIDLFGITSNTNWITQVGQLSEVANTWYEQMENGVLRVYIDLKSKMHWGYGIQYDSAGKKLDIRVKHRPDRHLKNLFVAVDAGHGGSNTGAAGDIFGKAEKKLTLEYALALEKELKKAGVRRIFMTRRSDTTLSMPERILMLRDTMPDVLLSIHFNSSSVDTVKGTSTFYRYIGFRPFTQYILNRMKQLKLTEFGNVGSFNFALSGPTEYPNCLIEVAFLSNPEDERFIMQRKSPEKVAVKIREGLSDWLKSMHQ